MSLVITGKIVEVLPVESGTSKEGKEWKKQNIIIDTYNQFNPNVCINAFGDEKIALLGNFKSGQEVEVSINLSSREFNGKYYHNIDMWKIEAVAAKANTSTDVPVATEEDDLPF